MQRGRDGAMNHPAAANETESGFEIRHLGLQDYSVVWNRMREFTARRNHTTPDEIWLVEHPPVFTLGTNGKESHLLNPGYIPVVRSDRGGQVTYHGPGQLVAYLLIDLKRRRLGVRALVGAMEQSIIGLLAEYRIKGETLAGAPGVYVAGAKIAALGLRIRKGCSYHGLSLNVELDLNPFQHINPCGYQDMEVTSLHDIGVRISTGEVEPRLLNHLTFNLQNPESEAAPL